MSDFDVVEGRRFGPWYKVAEKAEGEIRGQDFGKVERLRRRGICRHCRGVGNEKFRSFE